MKSANKSKTTCPICNNRFEKCNAHRKYCSKACLDISCQLYSVWSNMIRRCNNPSHRRYKRYGGRGITVCDEWLNNFDAFMKWAIVAGYTSGLTIDRRENNSNYSPENCRFVTQQQNCRNTSANRNITAFGETKCLQAWAEDERCVVSIHTLNKRLDDGWRPETAITTKAIGRETHARQIDWDTVKAIRQFWSDGLAADDIACRLSITRHIVIDVALNRTWVDVDYTPKPRRQRKDYAVKQASEKGQGSRRKGQRR
jgi:hypothetical protein